MLCCCEVSLFLLKAIRGLAFFGFNLMKILGLGDDLELIKEVFLLNLLESKHLHLHYLHPMKFMNE
jgi:hypothetical protein